MNNQHDGPVDMELCGLEEEPDRDTPMENSNKAEDGYRSPIEQEHQQRIT